MTSYKLSKPSSKTLEKSAFPHLLNQLLSELHEENMKTNILSGFKKCGIIPFNPQAVYSRIPDGQIPECENVTNKRVNMVHTVLYRI